MLGMNKLKKLSKENNNVAEKDYLVYRKTTVLCNVLKILKFRIKKSNYSSSSIFFTNSGRVVPAGP